MIVLAVMTYNGAPTEPVEASFDELGGTVGRADGNLMVLPDPERTISRVHAKVVFRNGTYAIEDRGSNPILVNGNVVGHGKEWPLNPGDVVQIGGYELGVRASDSPAATDDPFADVFAPAAQTDLMSTAPVPPPAFAAAPAPKTAPRRAVAPAAPAAGLAGMPSDWNPLAEDTHLRHGGALPLEADPGDLIGGGGAGDESIDDLFGLGDAKPKDNKAWPEDDDFLGIFDPNGPASGGVGEPVAKPRREDVRIDHSRSELEMAFPNAVSPAMPTTPPPVTRAPPTPPPAAAAPAPRAQPDARRGAVVSWDGGGARQATIVAPIGGGRRGGSMATVSGGTRPGIQPAGAAAPAPAAAAATAGSDELLHAFLDGLGTVQAPPITTLTPTLMRLIGTLLAESVRGAVDLLHARASVKREVRAEVTAIRPRQNNPLKFSPTAALAMQHLLGPKVPGFMGADDAMRDAFRDLRAHELAVMAGMRSALAGLLQRFDPKSLESRMTGKSGIGMLLAGGRRAQLWEAYQELFGQLSAEAEDDFHEVFGRAFLQAYQEQLDRLDADDGAGSD
jgi:FHA domain-containing protein